MNQIVENADVMLSDNGHVHVFISKDNKTYVPKKRGVMQVFHLVYKNITDRKDHRSHTNVYVEF